MWLPYTVIAVDQDRLERGWHSGKAFSQHAIFHPEFGNKRTTVKAGMNGDKLYRRNGQQGIWAYNMHYMYNKLCTSHDNTSNYYRVAHRIKDVPRDPGL